MATTRTLTLMMVIIMSTSASIFDYNARLIGGGDPMQLSDLKGKVTLVVNTACFCGYTDNHLNALAHMESQYKDEDFQILLFPSHDFDQDKMDNEFIEQFIRSYGITGPIFAKSTVNGECDQPLESCEHGSTKCCPGNEAVFEYLRSATFVIGHKDKITWNFSKFLVGKDGVPVFRADADVDPRTLEPAIEVLLYPATEGEL